MRQPTLQSLGVSTTWDPADREDVQRFHRKLWRKRRAELLNGDPRASLADVPGFLDSVQHLHDYGYSFTDIGTYFGVTREAVRQWFEKYDLERYGSGAMLRMWDDELMCFVPVSTEEYLEAAREPHRQAVERSKEARPHVAQWVIRDLMADLGRLPTRSEVGEALFPNDVNPSASLGAWLMATYGYDLSSAEVVKRLYEDMGLGRPQTWAPHDSEAILQQLRDLAAELGHTPRMKDVDARGDMPDPQTYVNHFGSWTDAALEAGLEPNSRAHPPKSLPEGWTP